MNLNPNTEGNVLNDNLARKKDVLIESTENKKEAELNKFSDLVFNLSSSPEPFGRTMIEAISCGSKVIGWNHGGTKEILEELFPEGLVYLNDIESLKQKVIIISNKDHPLPKENSFTSYTKDRRLFYTNETAME